MHLIRPEKVLEVPLKFGVGGYVKIKRRDMRSGKVDLVREEKPNMLLGEYWNKIFTYGRTNLLGWGTNGLFSGGASSGYLGAPFDTCHIGSGSTAPTFEGSHIETSLASSSSSTLTEKSEYGKLPAFIERLWVFPAGVGTGTINEVGLQGNTNIPESSARQLVSPAIEKSEYHQIEVSWKIVVNVETVVTGTTVGGQRNGTTDIDWRLTMNENQIAVLLGRTSAAPVSGASSWGNVGNPFGLYFRISSNSGRPYTWCANSNAESVLATDSFDARKGTDIFAGSTDFAEATAYAANSLERTFRIGWDIENANGNLCEVVGRTMSSTSTSSSFGGLFRIAFKEAGTAWGANVGLDKVDNFRLFLDFKVSIEDVNAT